MIDSLVHHAARLARFPSLRDLIAAVVALAALLSAALASAQFYGWRRCSMDDHVGPLTEVVIQRWHFGTNGRIGHCGWSHNYPYSEINFNEFVGRTTRVLTQDVVLSDAMARQEVERYTFRGPGQATSYFYGYTRLREIRDEIARKMGKSFEPKKFHDFVLAQGLVPPSLLRRTVMEEFLKAGS